MFTHTMEHWFCFKQKTSCVLYFGSPWVNCQFPPDFSLCCEKLSFFFAMQFSPPDGNTTARGPFLLGGTETRNPSLYCKFRCGSHGQRRKLEKNILSLFHSCPLSFCISICFCFQTEHSFMFSFSSRLLFPLSQVKIIIMACMQLFIFSRYKHNTLVWSCVVGRYSMFYRERKRSRWGN